ncbi:hypothetical protein HOY80DRAFT_1078479, partial [Tuber brumale]
FFPYFPFIISSFRQLLFFPICFFDILAYFVPMNLIDIQYLNIMSEKPPPIVSTEAFTISSDSLPKSTTPTNNHPSNNLCTAIPPMVCTPLVSSIHSDIVPVENFETLANTGEQRFDVDICDEKLDDNRKTHPKKTRKRRCGQPIHAQLNSTSSSSDDNGHLESIESKDRSMSNKKVKLAGYKKTQHYSTKKQLENDSMRQQNIQTAASELFGYIALNPCSWDKDSMEHWVDATIFSLAESNRSAEAVLYLAASSQTLPATSSSKHKTVPVLQVRFRTEGDLNAVLGPITILGYQTKLERYRGEKSCIFKVCLGTWAGEEGKLYKALEEQAMVQVQEWGWRQLCKMRTHIVMRTTLLPGKVINSIRVDGWWLECQREEEDKNLPSDY